MHPQRDHRTSTTPYDEARWLGFFNMGAQTAPAAKVTSFTAADTSPTPTKFAASVVSHAATPVNAKVVTAPDFQFTFRRAPSVELSEDAQKIMEESRAEAAKIRAQLASLPTVPDNEPEEHTEIVNGRKIAKAKGKAGRFSDVHMQGFKKMDSIAGHASAWRVDPNRKTPGPVTQALKRSPSKAELDKPLPTPGLKRSPSKAGLNKPVAHALQRSPSKPTLRKVESNPFLTRSPSKLGLNAHAAPVEERPQPSAKRVKHFREEDAGIARPKESESPVSSTVTPRRQTQGLVRSKSGLLRPGFSSAMSPTKSSMARIQSPQKATTQIPALVRSDTNRNLRQAAASGLPRSKSMRDLNGSFTPHSAAPPVSVTAPGPSPSKIAYLPLKSPVRGPELQDASMTSSPASGSTPKRIKSILRTPNRRYTRDPLKIAAGTHLATPPSKSELYPNVPATEPVVKRVDFTNSTKDKAERDAAKAASVEPESVAYPDLPTTKDINRRTTMAAMPTVPGAFTFRSDREISFGSPKTSTIRQVRTSDAGLPPAFQFTGAPAPDYPTKRKLDTLDEVGETSEKENQDEDEYRPAKKARVFSGAKSAPPTPVARKAAPASKLPRFGAKRTGGLTAARLSMLAKPKKRV